MASKPRYKVPDELRGILLDFTIAYLLERPQNISTFGLDFFQRLQSSGRVAESTKAGPSASRAVTHSPSTNTRRSPDAQNANPPVEPSDGDEENGDYVDVTAPRAKVTKDGRRKSVFAEAYNPEEDEDEETKVYPKTDEQKAKLGEAVRNILLFRSLDNKQIQDVIDAMFEKKVTAGEDVILQGDDGDNFYVVESGKYQVFVETEGEGEHKVVATYDGSGSFGELALMYNMPRAATVQAETDGNLWAMDRQTFRKIVLKDAYKKRQMYESLIDSVPMLKQLESYERMNLADALTSRTFSDGETIIKQDDAADGMYFVEEGEATVVAKVDNKGDEKEVVNKDINRVSKGGYFGELALLTKKPRAATVKAVGEIKLAFLDVDAFERLLGPCMEIMKRNAADYEQQLLNIFGSKSQMTDIR